MTNWMQLVLLAGYFSNISLTEMLLRKINQKPLKNRKMFGTAIFGNINYIFYHNSKRKINRRDLKYTPNTYIIILTFSIYFNKF